MSNSVFISYARKDGAEFAAELRDWIQGNDVGLPVFQDIAEIKWGDDWKIVIDKAIEDSFVLIVVVTRQAAESINVTYEWSYAMGLRKLVLPLFVDPNMTDKDIHPKLGSLQYLKFVNPTTDDWTKLREEIFKRFDEGGIDPSVQKAIDGLNDVSQVVRNDAIQALKANAHASSIRALREAIKSNYPDVVKKASMVLAEKTDYQDRSAIPGIEQNAQNGDYEDQPRAIRYLGRYGDIQAAKSIAHIYDNLGPKPQAEVIDLVKHFTDKSTIPDLQKLVEKGNPLQFACVLKLAEFRDVESIVHIVAYLEWLIEIDRRSSAHYEQEDKLFDAFLQYDLTHIQDNLKTLAEKYATGKSTSRDKLLPRIFASLANSESAEIADWLDTCISRYYQFRRWEPELKKASSEIRKRL